MGSDTADFRAAELEVKTRLLRDPFPPDRIGWNSATSGIKVGEAATCVPFVAAEAVRDRLDAALGADSWSEAYDNPGEYTRCTLRVRFTDGGDWVSRVGLSNAKALDRAHAESLRAAALSLGVGRYLVPHVACVKWDGAKLERVPKLPEYAIPEEYRRCGREIGLRIRNLVNTAAKDSCDKGRTITQKEAARILAYKCGGYVCDENGEVDFSKLQNRHATEAMRRAADWIAELAKGQTNGPACPLDTPAPGQNQGPQQK